MSSNVATADAGVVTTPSKRWMVWTGRILSCLPVVTMLASATMKLAHQSQMAEIFESKFGYPASLLTALGVLELVCILLYAIPKTAILGAVLVTAYLGGATATHVRVHDAFIAPVIVGVLVWAGLFLRDKRVRALLPLRR